MKIGSQGSEVDIGSIKWDKTKMHGLDAPKAKLDHYVNSDDSIMYGFSEMQEKDAEEFIKEIKKAGFTYNCLTIEDYNFKGTNRLGFVISFLYNKETGDAVVKFMKDEAPSEDSNGSEGIVGGRDKEWNSKMVGGLPAPGAGIITFFTIDGDTGYVFEKLDDHKKYVEQIRACGFDIESCELEIAGTYMYVGFNRNGAQVILSISADAGTLTYIKNH